MTSSHVDLFSQPTNYTDAVLLVEDKKMHVNKANLSYYSDFFNTLFNSDFAEKSMPEIPINDVKYEDLALLLGVFHREKPVLPTCDNAEKLLELADRFMMPHVTHQVEGFLLTCEPMIISAIFLADKFRLEALLKTAIDSLKNQLSINQIVTQPDYKTLRDETKVRVLERILILKNIEPGSGFSSPKTLKRKRCESSSSDSSEGIGSRESDESSLSDSDDSDEDDDFSDEESTDEEDFDEDEDCSDEESSDED